MIFFSMTDESVSGVMPYLSPRASNSAFPSRQSLTDCGILSPNFSMRSFKPIKSLIDPLAAFSRIYPAKTTILWAVSSSIHGTIVFGSGSLFCSNSPFKVCWMISLSVNEKAEIVSMANNKIYFIRRLIINIKPCTKSLINNGKIGVMKKKM